MARAIELRGIGEVNKALKSYAKKYPAATANAIYTEALEIEREATRRAPVEFARLRGSAYTVPPTEKNITSETGFGTEYAAAQHEGLTFQHPRGGEAKYLENAVNMRASGMIQRLVEKIKSLVSKGVETYPAATSNTRPVVKPAPKKSRKTKVQKRPKATQVKRQSPKRRG